MEENIMKKTLVAVAVLGALSVSSITFAAEAGTSYVGVKAGWGHVEAHSGRNAVGVSTDEKNDYTYGLYTGYNFSKFFGAEIGYDYLGQYSNKGAYNGTNLGDYTVHGAEIATLIGLPFNETDDVFLKLGGLYANTKDDNFDSTGSKFVPLLGLGSRVAFGDFLVRLEYTYAHKFAEINDFGYAPDLNNLSLGLEYKFGGAEPVVAAAPAPEPAVQPQTVIVEKNFALDSTALFTLGSSKLSNTGKDSVAKVSSEIKNNDLKNVQIKVEGHTDRIGSDESNMKLSKARARTVVEEFVADGIDPSVITAEGYGESKPVTGTKCDKIANRAKLVECLAPDRRVEVKFSGVSQETETK
jgi:OmpA-OmpF porin, OOP family